MKSFLYGIKKVFFSYEIELPFNTLSAFNDGESVSAGADWQELQLVAPGSLLYVFSRKDNTNVCQVTLDFKTFSDFFNPFDNVFFKAVDTAGNNYLIGLGDGYDTVPVTSVTDSIGSTAEQGNSTTVKVTWNCRCGRILTLS